MKPQERLLHGDSLRGMLTVGHAYSLRGMPLLLLSRPRSCAGITVPGHCLTNQGCPLKIFVLGCPHRVRTCIAGSKSRCLSRLGERASIGISRGVEGLGVLGNKKPESKGSGCTFQCLITARDLTPGRTPMFFISVTLNQTTETGGHCYSPGIREALGVRGVIYRGDHDCKY